MKSSDRKPVAVLLSEITQAKTPRNLARFVPIMGQGLLAEFRSDKEKLILPSWFKLPPTNAGDVKHGKLSSKEWRSLYTVGILVTLVRTWGLTYKDHPTTGKEEVLDNYLHLAVATMLATQGTMADTVIALYEIHMRTYLEGFKVLYPTHSIIPYHHLALHVPKFMRLLGPWPSWGTGPYEMFNGMAQKIRTNSIFGM